MDIVILADFCGRFEGDGQNIRFLYLANILCKNNDVEIITSDFNHGTKTFFTEAPKQFPYPVTMVHESGYKKNISVKRFISHFEWGRNVKKYLHNRKKPDVIFAAVPTLYAPFVASEYCEREGIKFIIDIQDLWPEAFRMAFNIPVVSNILFSPFKFLADNTYRRADAVCAVSKTYVDRALTVNRKVKNGLVVFLGSDLSAFDAHVLKNKDTILNEVGLSEKKDEELWLAYCGGMGDSYDLECVIDSLRIVKERGFVPPKFIAMGEGFKMDRLKKRAAENGVDAVFTGKLPYEKMCALLSKCDITVNPIVGNSAASIINKHSDYASSGLPVLNTQESKEYCELVEAYNMGINCKNGDPNDLAEGIIRLISDPSLMRSMGINARRCAEDRFNRQMTYKGLVDVITD